MIEGAKRPLVGALLCVVASAVLFSRGLGAPFIFDDSTDVVDRFALREGVVAGAKSSPSRAVTYASYAFDMERGEGDPKPFHETNLALHAIFVGLLYGFIYSFLKRNNFKNADVAAGIGTLFFGLHPLLVSNVTYISGRAGILASIFSICALWLYQNRPFKFWIFPALVAFALALFSKEDAASLPVIMAALEWNRPPSERSFKVPAVFLGTAAVFTVLRFTTDRVDYGVEGPSGASLLFTPYAWIRGMFTIVHPLWLNIDPRTPQPIGFHWQYLCFIPIILLIYLTQVLWKRNRVASVPFIWFFAAMGPTGIIPLADVYMENRFYFAFAGLTLLIAMYAAKSLEIKRKNLVYGSFASVFVMLAVLTDSRNLLMKDRLALWTDSARKDPTNVRAFVNIGQTRFDYNDLNGAMFFLKKAPGDATALNSLGLVFKDQKRYIDALAAYDKAIALSPGLHKVRTNRAAVLLQIGRTEEAERGYLDAIEVDPTDSDAHYGLGFLYFMTKRPQLAVSELEKTLELNPNDDEARDLLESLKRGY